MLLASFHPVLVAFGGFFSKELNLWSAAAPSMLAWQKQSDQKHPPLVVAARSVELTRQLPPTASLPHFT